MDRLTGDPILGPKLLSFACTWLALGAIFLVSLRSERGGTAGHVLTVLALGAFLLFDPVVIFTAGKTWNHEVPACLLVLSVCAHVAALRRDSLAWIALSGAACGLAVGTRLTVLPCLLPLFGLTFFFPVERKRRCALAAVFVGSATLALAPSIFFLATARDAFLFDNLQFPRLRLLDPENTRIQKTMSGWRKLRFFVKEVVLPSWPVFVAFGALLIPAIRRRLSAVDPTRSGLLVVAWTALFLVLGCSLPSRYQYQHFFALIPLLTLGLALTGSGDGGPSPRRLLLPIGLVLLAGAGVVAAINPGGKGNQPFPGWDDIRHRDEWFSSEAADFGAELRRHVPDGRILTLAPAWPIAGGLRIYPEFATGPFAWRSARFVPVERRAEFHFVGPDELAALLQKNPPGGILTSVEDDDLEAPLIAYAQRHGYTPIKLSRKRLLWRP